MTNLITDLNKNLSNNHHTSIEALHAFTNKSNKQIKSAIADEYLTRFRYTKDTLSTFSKLSTQLHMVDCTGKYKELCKDSRTLIEMMNEAGNEEIGECLAMISETINKIAFALEDIEDEYEDILADHLEALESILPGRSKEDVIRNMNSEEKFCTIEKYLLNQTFTALDMIDELKKKGWK